MFDTFFTYFRYMTIFFIYVGNCWFLAAIGALTFEKDIMKQVMPAEQSLTKDYTGIFHFRVTIPVQ